MRESDSSALRACRTDPSQACRGERAADPSQSGGPGGRPPSGDKCYLYGPILGGSDGSHA